jgi:hypothetical protein
MPKKFDELERQVLRAFRRALADGRLDVAEHLLQALEVLDPEFEGLAVRDACRSILKVAEAPPSRH